MIVREIFASVPAPLRFPVRTRIQYFVYELIFAKEIGTTIYWTAMKLNMS